MEKKVAVIGAGLAGCECALKLAQAGIRVVLYEQKPQFRSEAHVSDDLAELVCSNSLRSAELTSGVGLLKQEMRELGSAFMEAADRCRIPADKALAVDRQAFSRYLTQKVQAEERIERVCRRIDSLDDPLLSAANYDYVALCAGPLASEALSNSLAQMIGNSHCYFYDAIAPIVWTESLDQSIVFRASRYDCEAESFDPTQATGDYLNCPMNKEEYLRFYQELCEAKTVPSHAFEQLKHFEGCMPIEALAQRGARTLVFGPLKPVGFVDPRTGRRPYAVLQLRAEKADFETCNLVGCQTRMLQSEQQRVFRLIPGMANAEFVRLGSMHRNTYVNAPCVLNPDLSLKMHSRIFLAGQITGVEGYVESAACGLWLALVLRARYLGQTLPQPPRETALGALLGHLQTECKKFQPSNVHFGLMPAPEERLRKKDRKQAYAERARRAFALWMRDNCEAS
ncbi:MAG: methylenetetrahydrofolate--tRNA-(uracil(54)-C(5))-methyltransferase (FADH(2)-oxidizing) TrmFO [Desulfovibrio sp.]|nr:methylenetetrahydrofolate--tRNA-(uracil(54)-C(5))-methyltransferase (FADH(2)-oxidizing) TrmFO [Desulfovibrio sp.]